MPGWLLLILRRATGSALADDIAGDLLEERRRRAVRSVWRAELWLWRTAAGIVLYGLIETRRGALRHLAGGCSMQKIVSDLRHAARSIRRRPGATVAMLLVLALGIGLTSAMFALADPYLFKPLPYGGPERLVVISLSAEHRRPGPFPTLEEWRSRRDLFADAAAYTAIDIETIRVRLADGGAALQVARVSESFFDVLGWPIPLPPDWASAAGSGATPVIVTTNADVRLLASARTPGSSLPSHEGGVVRLSGTLPATFVFPRNRTRPRVDALAPLPAGPLMEVRINGSSYNSTSRQVIARLAAGVTPEIVDAALEPPDSPDRAYSVDVVPLDVHMTARLRPLAFGAFGAGLLVLLVCAANVSNLLLARGAFRGREFATRHALGASRLDLMRLVLAELAALAGLGVAGGIACAMVALWIAGAAIPDDYAALGSPAVTFRVVAFAVAAGAAVMLAGAVPGWAAWHFTPASLPAHGAIVETRRLRLVRFAMAAGQSAVAMILVAGAAMLGRSFLNLAIQDSGFDGDAIVFSVSYPPGHAGDPLQADIEATVDRLRRIPAVSAAAAAIGAMVDGSTYMTGARVGGRGVPIERKSVTAAYFDAAGMNVLQGRPLQVADSSGTGVVVNARLARLFAPGDAIGQVLYRNATIVGVVADTFEHALDQPPAPTVFDLLARPSQGRRVSFVVRTTEPGATIDSIARRAIAGINSDAIITEVSTIDDRLAASVTDRAFATFVLAFFALAGLSVCAAGLAGIVSFIVARRTREIAIRTAIGADARHIRRLVMRQAMTAAIAGATGGLLAGWWLSKSLEGLLYGVAAGDWQTLTAGAAVLLIVVVLAAWIPARRALQLSPTIALRVE